ncbi:MAG: hypothetical protein IT338_16120 [Thermomicrobiales bacterium]|nr:hypothetical protein [Thermomicrobiales bacterium]
MSAVAYEVSLSPVRLDPRINQTRAPTLPSVAQGPGFERRFDATTLFYDLFREADGNAILAIGPHVPTHLDPERDIAFHCLASGERLDAEYLPSRGQIHNDMYRIEAGPGTPAVRVVVGGQQIVAAVQPNLSPLLAGRRVLTNRCRNDPLEWLVDWTWFHAREFGFDAIVHYDNGSTDYTADDVRLALSRVPGMDVVIVLSWPFPIEPPHAVVPATGEMFWSQLRDRWAESGRLEHQRRRFAAQAELVLVADVDELLIRRNDRAALEGYFADPGVAWVRFDSEVVVHTQDPADRLLRHRDLSWIRHEPGFKTPKYVVKPNRCPDEARWWLHDVAWAPGIDTSRDDFTIGHFISLTTGWGGKGQRGAAQRPEPGIHYQDLALRAKLNRVFREAPTEATRWSPATSGNPHLLRKAAHDLADRGDLRDALDLLHRAMAIDPWQPAQHELRREVLARLAEASDRLS